MSWLFQPLLPSAGHQQAAAGGTDALSKLDFAVSSPALGTPNLINTKATNLTVGSPALGAPSLINTKASNLTVGSPVIGAPALTSGAAGISRTNLYGASPVPAAGVAVTGSFTPPANSLLVVSIFSFSTSDESAGFSISGGGLTYTSRKVQDTVQGGLGGTTTAVQQLWTAPVGASPSSMAITITGHSGLSNIDVHVVAYTGCDTASIGATGSFRNAYNSTGINDSASITLSASPLTTSAVFSSICCGANNNAGPVTVGVGWTEIYDFVSTDANGLGFQSQDRTGSTSATVSWADVDTNNGTSGLWGCAGFALEIVVPGGATTLSASNLTVSALALGTPSLTAAVAMGLTVSSPSLGTPNLVNTVPAGKTVGSPVLGTPSLINTVPLSLTTTSPVLGTPALAVSVTLSATPLTVTPPLALGAPNLINTKAIGITVGSPTIGAPVFTQNHVFTALAPVGSPVIPGLRLGYVIVPNNLTVSSPAFTLSNLVNTVPAGKTVSSPVLGAPLFYVNALLYLGDRTLDVGLNALDSECDRIYVCSQQPKSFAEVSTYAIGFKHWGAGNAFGAEAAGSPDGRVVTSATIVDGSITVNGPATCWAAVDTVNSRFLASGPMTGGKTVSSGQSFTLNAIPIHLGSA